MNKIQLLLFSVLILLTSCKSTKDNIQLIIASEKRTAIGVAPMEVLVVKEGNSPTWSFFYSDIEGFEYKPGYEYILLVTKEKIEAPIPADKSSIKYILVKELSKTQKESENMPKKADTEVQYSWTAKITEIKDVNIGVGAAKDKFPVKVLKLEVTAVNSSNTPFAVGDIIHAEFEAGSATDAEVGVKYHFEAKTLHTAHALGIYMLKTKIKGKE